MKQFLLIRPYNATGSTKRASQTSVKMLVLFHSVILQLVFRAYHENHGILALSLMNIIKHY